MLPLKIHCYVTHKKNHCYVTQQNALLECYPKSVVLGSPDLINDSYDSYDANTRTITGNSRYEKF